MLIIVCWMLYSHCSVQCLMSVQLSVTFVLAPSCHPCMHVALAPALVHSEEQAAHLLQESKLGRAGLGAEQCSWVWWMGEAHTNDVHYDPMVYHLRTNTLTFRMRRRKCLTCESWPAWRDQSVAVRSRVPSKWFSQTGTYVSVYTVGLACTRI